MATYSSSSSGSLTLRALLKGAINRAGIRASARRISGLTPSARALALGAMVASAYGAALRVLHAERFEPPPYFTIDQIARLEAERRTSQAAAVAHVVGERLESGTEHRQAETLDAAPAQALCEVDHSGPGAQVEQVMVAAAGQSGVGICQAKRQVQAEVDENERPDDPDEFYDRELIGLRVRTTDGEDAGEAYYRQWLAALEDMVAAKGASSAAELEHYRAAWDHAADRTPHIVRPDHWFVGHDRNECDDGVASRFLPALMAALDLVEEAIVVLDATAQVLHANRAASVLLDKENGISQTREGRLHVADRHAADLVRGALSRIANPCASAQDTQIFAQS